MSRRSLELLSGGIFTEGSKSLLDPCDLHNPPIHSILTIPQQVGHGWFSVVGIDIALVWKQMENDNDLKLFNATNFKPMSSLRNDGDVENEGERWLISMMLVMIRK